MCAAMCAFTCASCIMGRAYPNEDLWTDPAHIPPCMQYRNPWGHIRIGCVLEDLDSMAGNIAWEHW